MRSYGYRVQFFARTSAGYTIEITPPLVRGREGVGGQKEIRYIIQEKRPDYEAKEKETSERYER